MIQPYYNNKLTTIYNGDCFDVMDYLIEQGVRVDAIITDPPYGTTACSWDNIIPFDKMWERLKKLRKDKTPIVLFGSEPFSSYMRTSNIDNFKYDWIWNKKLGGNIMLTNYQPLKTHEIISVFYKHNYYPLKVETGRIRQMKNNGVGVSAGNINEPYKGEYKTTINPKSIIVVGNTDRKNILHNTQKPVELLSYLIKTYTKKGDLILDFTAGSFTTCIAAEQLNRRSIGIELEKKYCDIGIKRLSNLQMRFDI